LQNVHPVFHVSHLSPDPGTTDNRLPQRIPLKSNRRSWKYTINHVHGRERKQNEWYYIITTVEHPELQNRLVVPRNELFINDKLHPKIIAYEQQHSLPRLSRQPSAPPTPPATSSTTVTPGGATSSNPGRV
jgi:hypothetical protein